MVLSSSCASGSNHAREVGGETLSSYVLSNSDEFVAQELIKIRARIESLSGSHQDWARNSDRSSVEFQQRIRACMENSGFVYVPSVSQVNFSGAVKQPFAWWGGVDQRTLSEHGLGLLEERLFAEGVDAPVTPPNPDYDALSTSGKASFEARLSQCSDAALDAEPTGVDAINNTGYDLFHEIDDRVELAVSDNDELHRVYVSCMSGSGFSVASPQHIWDGALEDKFDHLGAYEGTIESSTFAQALNFERLVALTDARCRLAMGQDLVDLLQTEVGAWEEDHASEVASLKDLWKS